MKRIATVFAVLAMMLTPGAAWAQSSTCQAYNPQLCNTSASSEGTEAASASTGATGDTSAGTLPFTGLDLGLLAVGGAVLLVAGVIVRARISRSN
jgi:hypothetical protein